MKPGNVFLFMILNCKMKLRQEYITVTSDELKSFFDSVYSDEISKISKVNSVDVFSESDVQRAVEFFSNELSKEELRHYAGKVIFSKILTNFTNTNKLTFRFFGRDNIKEMEAKKWSRIQFLLVTFKSTSTGNYGAAIFDAWSKSGNMIRSDSTKITKECENFHHIFSHMTRRIVSESKTVINFGKTTLIRESPEYRKNQDNLKLTRNYLDFFLVNDARNIQVTVPGSIVKINLHFGDNGDFLSMDHEISEAEKTQIVSSYPPPIYNQAVPLPIYNQGAIGYPVAPAGYLPLQQVEYSVPYGYTNLPVQNHYNTFSGPTEIPSIAFRYPQQKPETEV